jgi:deazaflavin-dependent oxidoreductase (nitroreductase family)
MGLAPELGYTFTAPNAVQRGMQRLAATRGGASFLSKTLHPADRGLFRVTNGRVTASSLASGLPVIMVTTTGAKSGLPREIPLVGIPTGDDLSVIGSGFGQAPTPGWVHNLRKHPETTVAYRGRSIDVLAREVFEESAESIWTTAIRLYPGYAVYSDRAFHRRISVFTLLPAT